jgi:hypothetical protein
VLPGGQLAAAIGGVSWVPAYGMIVFLLLRFPDGRPLSPRWAVADRLALLGIGLATVGITFHPHQVLPQDGLRVDNPYAIPALKVLLEAMVALGGLLILGTMIAGVVSLVLRWRRSSGTARLQLKWFTYAAAVVAVLVLASLDVTSHVLLGAIQAVLIGPTLALAAGIAILRHRLYDIDYGCHPRGGRRDEDRAHRDDPAPAARGLGLPDGQPPRRHWINNVVEVGRGGDQPVADGVEIDETLKFLGIRVPVTMTVSEHRPTTHSAVDVSGPVPGRGSYDLAPAGDGTRLTMTFEADAHGFFKLTEPVFARLARRDVTSSLETLKDLLEARNDSRTHGP